MNGVPVPPEERSQWFTNKAVGFRDVYWCSRLNEPVLLEFKAGFPVCRNCDSSIEPDDGDHIFLGHVRKPY